MEILMDAFRAATQEREKKRTRNGDTNDTRPTKRDKSKDNTAGGASLEVRIGESARLEVDRHTVAGRSGVVGLFEDDRVLDLPSRLPTIPDEACFARACIQVLRRLDDDEGDWNQPESTTRDCWIVADYLDVSHDGLYVDLYRASTDETIEWLLDEFPHMAPVVSRCAWRETEEGQRERRQRERQRQRRRRRMRPDTSRMIVDGVYAHLCDTFICC